MSRFANLAQDIFDELVTYLTIQVTTSILKIRSIRNKIESESFYRSNEFFNGYGYFHHDPLLSLHATGNKLLQAKIFRCKQLVLNFTPRTTLLYPNCTQLMQLAIPLDMIDILKQTSVYPKSLTKLSICEPTCKKFKINFLHEIAFPKTLTQFNLRVDAIARHMMPDDIEHILLCLPNTLLSIDFPDITCCVREMFPNIMFVAINDMYSFNSDLIWSYFPAHLSVFESSKRYGNVDFENIPKHLISLNMPFANSKISDTLVAFSENLTRLHIDKMAGLTENCICILPRTLTSLRIKINIRSKTNFLSEFPANLKHLFLNCLGNLRFENLNGLPQHLDYLHIIAKVNTSNVTFPPKLLTLKFFNNAPIDKSLWTNLPQSITSLAASYNFSAKDFKIDTCISQYGLEIYDGISCLLNLPPGLKHIYLSHSKVTEKLRQCFCKTFPEIKIHQD
jgi:hypothetical protein